MALAAGWLIGTYVAGWPPEAVAGGFPTQLFLTVAGVTLLFAISDVNRTVAAIARRVLSLARGSTRLVPLMFFAIAMAISTIGPGAIASVALVAPIAMALGAESKIPPLLTALMVANGARARSTRPSRFLFPCLIRFSPKTSRALAPSMLCRRVSFVSHCGPLARRCPLRRCR